MTAFRALVILIATALLSAGLFAVGAPTGGAAVVSTWYFSNSLTGGAADFEIDFGSPTDSEFFVGDWNGNGIDDLATRNGNVFTLLDTVTRNVSTVGYGKAGDEVFVGDWDGNGTDTFAVRRGNIFFVRNSVTPGNADVVLGYGKAGDEVFVGDWDGNGNDTFAVRRGNIFFVRNSVTTGVADVVFGYGRAADDVLVGDWNADGNDSFAVRRGNEIFIRNDFLTAPAEFSFGFGKATDELYPGDWNGNGQDTFAVRRVVDSLSPIPTTPPVPTATPAPIPTTTPTPTTPTPTTTPIPSPPAGAPVIDVWNGTTQSFGQNGRPQPQINVLGNVSDPQGVASLTYSVNGVPQLPPLSPLSWGPDLRRLDEPGDFNVEINRTDLNSGENTVVITARDTVGNEGSVGVTVNRIDNATSPGTVNWAAQSNINSAAQIVDGDWVLDGAEVRLADAAALGYDRVLAVGDQSWTDYEVTVPVRFEGHGDQVGAPLSGLPLFGLGLRWQGHTQEGTDQPSDGFYPVGAYTWFRWDPTLSTGRYELSGNDYLPEIRADGSVVPGDALVIKARVETIGGGNTRYRVKYWPAGTGEPSEWLLDITEDAGPASGSVALITHHSDVRFGTVAVQPV